MNQRELIARVRELESAVVALRRDLLAMTAEERSHFGLNDALAATAGLVPEPEQPK